MIYLLGGVHMFGDKLKQLRKQKKLTQEELANILDVARTTYSSYEQGRRMPDPEIQKRIAEYFNVSLDFLHGRKESDTQIKNDKVMTIAAHIDDDTSDEEMEEIIDYITYIKNKHKKK